MIDRPSRRTFLKGTGAVGGVVLLNEYLPDLDWVAATPDPGDATDDAAEGTEQWIPTTCWIGKQDCGILARVVDGRIVKLEGDPRHPRNRGTLCPKGMAQIQAIYDPNRVKTPLIRTNQKGISGTWRPASWDEALQLTADKMNAAIEKGPGHFVWQKGRSKAKKFYDDAFVKTTGAVKLHHGAYCSDAGYRGAEYTTGLHGVLHPDFRETRYLLSLGWNMMNGGGNKFCQITWHQQMLDAKERGLKIVHLDPSQRSAGSFADEWLPVKPSTDIAFLQAVSRELIENGFVDEHYLATYTNAPFLVGDDGLFMMVDDKEQVFDVSSEKIVPFDTEGAVPALEVSGMAAAGSNTTGYEQFKAHLDSTTPEWAESVCGIPAATIRRIAREMGEAAMIGSTTTMDGIELPYRPVAIMGYHVVQQELGFQLTRAALMLEMLLGAIEAVGGQRSDFKWSVYKNFEPFGTAEDLVKEGPYNLYLNKSKFFPINSNNSSIVAHAMIDPGRYELETMPEVMVIHMANPVGSFADRPAILEAFQKLEFIAVIDPWLSETADLLADVVLPAATIEKYEGPLNITDGYIAGETLRVPPMAPLFESRGDIDIYLDLCEKAGLLNGESGYLAQVNASLKLNDEFALDTETKPTVREIFDNYANQKGYEGGIEQFEQRGAVISGPVSAGSFYGFAADPPFSGIRHRLYGSSLKAAQDRMKALDVDEVYWRQYTALPTWMAPTMEGSPAEYDLYLTSRKLIEFKQARSTFVPLLNELMPEQFLEINSETASERDIEDGDLIVVESHHAITGETRQVTTKARVISSIRPDTVCMPHHYGMWTHPTTGGSEGNEDKGPSANQLFFSGPGYVSNTADQSFQVKVKVSKA